MENLESLVVNWARRHSYRISYHEYKVRRSLPQSEDRGSKYLMGEREEKNCVNSDNN